MSISATLHSAEESVAAPAVAMLRSYESDLLSIAVAVMPRPHFIGDDYGVDPNVLVHFVLDKDRGSQSRAALAQAVRTFLAVTETDVVVMYIDAPILRRAGGTRQVAPGYEEFVPDVSEWRVSSFETPAG